MKIISLFLIAPVLIFANISNVGAPTADDAVVQKSCEIATRLFESYADSIWPGYDLSSAPFMVYMPDKWALLFNGNPPNAGFQSYPSDWPHIYKNIQYFSGKYDDLSGQLSFDLELDSLKFAAIGYNGQPLSNFLGYLIHENFHQYQSTRFWEIPWAREELYPIEDSVNSALVCLEMKILINALEALSNHNDSLCKTRVLDFLAIRDLRWKTGNDYLRTYEQGQEINEGTAKYVEVKGLGLVHKLKYSSVFGKSSFPDNERTAAMLPQSIIADIKARMIAGAISPETVARHRIYSEGAALGYLLDYFHIDWKGKAQRAGESFTFAGIFQDAWKCDTSLFGVIVEKAKARFNYTATLSAVDSLVRAYHTGYLSELDKFNSQSGTKVKISLSSRGINRSRFSTSKKWLVENGSIELCPHFDNYVLKSKGLLFDFKDGALLENNDWNAKKKAVNFFDSGIKSISADDKILDINQPIDLTFSKLLIYGGGFTLNIEKTGRLQFRDNSLIIDINE